MEGNSGDRLYDTYIPSASQLNAVSDSGSGSEPIPI